MHWPGRIPAGKTYDQPVINLDLVPTIMSLSGTTKPSMGHAFDGVDLLPYLGGEKTDPPHDTLYWRRGEDYAIRQGDWKLAWNDQDRSGQIELFDMANDPGEWKSLAATHPERAQQLQDAFDAWDSGLADNQAGKNPNNRNSGYATGDRVSVAKFNAAIKPQPESAKPETKPATPVGGRTLDQQLAIARANAKKKGSKFDAARTTRWFRAKDLNKDGVLVEQELRTKAPVGWNE